MNQKLILIGNYDTPSHDHAECPFSVSLELFLFDSPAHINTGIMVTPANAPIMKHNTVQLQFSTIHPANRGPNMVPMEYAKLNHPYPVAYPFPAMAPPSVRNCSVISVIAGPPIIETPELLLDPRSVRNYPATRSSPTNKPMCPVVAGPVGRTRRNIPGQSNVNPMSPANLLP